MKDVPEFLKLVTKSQFTSKVQISFGTKSAGEGFDTYEKNYTTSYLNPITIKALVRSVSPQSLVWKKYGTTKVGSIQILTEKKYKRWFELASKIVYNDLEYTVFKDATGSNSTIMDYKGNIISVVLESV